MVGVGFCSCAGATPAPSRVLPPVTSEAGLKGTEVDRCLFPNFGTAPPAGSRLLATLPAEANLPALLLPATATLSDTSPKSLSAPAGRGAAVPARAAARAGAAAGADALACAVAGGVPSAKPTTTAALPPVTSGAGAAAAGSAADMASGSDADATGVRKSASVRCLSSTMMALISVPPAEPEDSAGAAGTGEPPKLKLSPVGNIFACEKQSGPPRTPTVGAHCRDYEADNLFFGYTWCTGRGG